MKPLTLYDFLRVGHIKRWHNVNTIRQQTVAEHSYLVTLIAIHMAGKIAPLNDKFVSTVAFAALFHDTPEVVMGDLPTPAKKFMRDFTGDPLLFGKMENALMPGVPYVGEPFISESVTDVVKMADAIEGAHWISENGAGKHAEIVAAAGWRRVEDTVEKLDNADPAANWYEVVNEVLMALGMRYVHKQSRITPP